MKQPQLGKKILELRLAKGLTQTELAEKCNLSLRTIQRIESTEVVPRSFTLKLIFKALDYDGFNLSNKSSSIHSEYAINSKKNAITIALLLLLTSILSIGIFKIVTKQKTHSVPEITEIISKNQSNIERWINNKQVDSVLTMYSKEACILNTICSKTKIRKVINDNINNGYEIVEYKTTSISVSDIIAVEKYENVYKFSGRTSKQTGTIEWQLINGEWLITNDFFREHGSQIIAI